MHSPELALNAICPYFTMFPLDFPLSVLEGRAKPGDWVIDPFCGRGTTNYAARKMGLSSIGLDTNPVAVAASQAKLVNPTVTGIILAAKSILDEVQDPLSSPIGEFWEWAYHRDVLRILCRLRDGLLIDCSTDEKIALRAIILGALHGPRGITARSYFSNQSPRTYAPKPKYAVSFWKKQGLRPDRVDVLNIIEQRAYRYYGNEKATGRGKIILGDSRLVESYVNLKKSTSIRWIITSPPYYGMNTYFPDQWLRLWFLGGRDVVDYGHIGQVKHSSPDEFSKDLFDVWENMAIHSADDAQLVIRFGALNSRKANPEALISKSLRQSSWKISRISPAGTALHGKRQAEYFLSVRPSPIEEIDIWAQKA